MTGHASAIRCVTYIPGGNILASGADDGEIRLWNLNGNNGPPITLRTQLKGVRSLTFAKNDLFAAGDGNRIYRWRINGPSVEFKEPLNVRSEAVLCIAASADGNRLAIVGTKEEETLVWDLEKGSYDKALLLPNGNKLPVVLGAWSSNGEFLATGDQAGEIRLRDARDGNFFLRLEWPAHSKDLVSLIWMPGGKGLISASEDGSLKKWEFQRKRMEGDQIRMEENVQQLKIASSAGVGGIAVSPDGRRLAIASHDGKVQLIPLE